MTQKKRKEEENGVDFRRNSVKSEFEAGKRTVFRVLVQDCLVEALHRCLLLLLLIVIERLGRRLQSVTLPPVTIST